LTLQVTNTFKKRGVCAHGDVRTHCDHALRSRTAITHCDHALRSRTTGEGKQHTWYHAVYAAALFNTNTLGLLSSCFGQPKSWPLNSVMGMPDACARLSVPPVCRSFGPIGQKFTVSVIEACARRPGAAAIVSRRRRERRTLLAGGGKPGL
jgi:hypothetical protein